MRFHVPCSWPAFGRLSCVLLLLPFGGCVHEAKNGAAMPARPPAARGETVAERPVAAAARAGVAALERRDFAGAVAEFSRALRHEPDNPHLHFLNGLAYHLWAEAADPGQYAHAAVGYRLALRFDAANAWAAYQLGRVEFAQRRYRAAQECFSQALLIDREHPDFQYALAAASYYAGDLATALGAVHELERAHPGSPVALRAAAIVHAAAGDAPRAEAASAAFSRAPVATGAESRQLGARVRDWQRFHGEGFRMVPAVLQGTPAAAPSTGAGAAGTAPSPAPVAPRPGPKMVQIDAVLIRSEERLTSRKGVNLLDGLRMTFAATPLDWARDFTRSPRILNDAQSIRVSASDITYSLNIFNDSDARNEVLAQPSLIATENVQAEFFSGANLYVAVGGDYGSGSVQQVKIGLKIAVMPRFVDDETIEMTATIDRDFIEPAAAGGSFEEFIQAASTHVTTHATLRFNETLIVSGLSERETEKTRSGVPGLQSIPGVQYAFTRNDELKFVKSVLVLLTPRRPHFVDERGARSDPPAGGADTVYLRELQQAAWFKPPHNLENVLLRLKQATIVREFRLEDLPLEAWHTPDRLSERLKRACRFLYF